VCSSDLWFADSGEAIDYFRPFWHNNNNPLPYFTRPNNLGCLYGHKTEKRGG
jgi:hypothetical protein